MFVILVPILILFLGFAFDSGMIWINRRFLQNAADGAALAGAQELPDNPAGAIDVACDYATVKNAVTGISVDCSGAIMPDADCNAVPTTVDLLICRTYVPGDSIRVITKKAAPTMFGSFAAIFGFNDWPMDVDVEADAVAVIGSLHTVCVFPLFQTQDRLEAAGAWKPNGSDFLDFNVPMIMKTSTDDSSSGNFLALQVNGSSSKDDWRDVVATPVGCQAQLTDTAQTSPGNYVGPFDKGMDSRADWWNNPSAAGYCPNTSPTFNSELVAVHPSGHPLAGTPLTPENCYRLVQIPLLEGVATDYNGSKPGVIRGFINFYISNWCGQLSDPKKGSGSDSQHCAAPAGTSLPELKYGELWGYYLKYEAVTDFPIQPYDGLGTKVVLLID